MQDVRVVSPPTIEPITLSQARRYLRLDVPGYSGDTSQDEDIKDWISSARQHIEKATDRSIGLQTLQLALDSFAPEFFTRAGVSILCTLPRGPVRSIESITYLDEDGFVQTVDPAVYRLTLTTPAQVALRRGQSWPRTNGEGDSILITYLAGYTTGPRLVVNTGYADNYADDYTVVGGTVTEGDPFERAGEDLIQAVRLLVAHFWTHRTALADQGVGSERELPMGVRALLWPNRASVGI